MRRGELARRREAGARLVQGTINGCGERCGNANLISILPALQLKLGYECVPPTGSQLLTETAHFVDELCNIAPDPDQPYVGRNAFATRAACTSPASRPTRAPSSTSRPSGRQHREVLISELSGRGSVLSPAESAGIGLDADGARRAVERQGARAPRLFYEAADASFDLMLRRETGDYEPLFRLESFRVSPRSARTAGSRPRPR